LHPDCVFLSLHGPFGEDGRIQGLLDVIGIPYAGSGCAASALAMDKIRAKTVASAAGIRVAKHVIFSHRDWEADANAVLTRVETELGFPCVLKNPYQGSSLGLAIPENEVQFSEAMNEVRGFGLTFLVEKFLKGTEVTCGVLDIDENTGPVALPVTEIRPVKSGYFDYQAKYTPGASDEITPAEIDDAMTEQVQAMAVRAHKAIGCEGFSRSDMILVDGDAYWLEVNTIPGFTETSLLPQGTAAAGISFTEFLTKVIEAACM
jgi:D-alanine-D-alanine ligase